MVESTQTAVLPVEHITQSILVLRGHRVLFDSELAALYAVSTRRSSEEVRRTLERIPADFISRAAEMNLYVVRAFVKLRAAVGIEPGAGPPLRAARGTPG